MPDPPIQGQLHSVDIREDLEGPFTNSTVVTETSRNFGNNGHYCDMSYDRGLLAVPSHDKQPNVVIFYKVESLSNNPTNKSYFKPDIKLLDSDLLKLPQSNGGASIPWGCLYPSEINESTQVRTFISSFFRERGALLFPDKDAGPNFLLYQVDASTKPPRFITQRDRNGNEIELPLPFSTKEGLPLDLRRIQGGAISEAGHLYISCDLELDETPGGGVHGFDLVTGRRIVYLPAAGGTSNAEIEGLTVWDVDAIGNKHSKSKGQIHLCVLNPRFRDRDKITLYHWFVNPDKRSLI